MIYDRPTFDKRQRFSFLAGLRGDLRHWRRFVLGMRMTKTQIIHTGCGGLLTPVKVLEDKSVFYIQFDCEKCGRLPLDRNSVSVIPKNKSGDLVVHGVKVGRFA